MIEDRIIEFLEENTEIHCYAELPDDESIKEFIVVRKTGGYRENYLDFASITIFAYSESKYKAALLDRNVMFCMQKFAKEDFITMVDQNNSYDDSDFSNKTYRYRSEYDIAYIDKMEG